MILGTVKCFDVVYGSGFISPDDGSADAYVHYAVIERAGLQELQAGQRVAFEIPEKSFSRIALRIQLLHQRESALA
jgi:cold shock protein